MFRVLVLQTLFTLSDDQTEYQIRDRLSFMRFVGLALHHAVAMGGQIVDATVIDLATGRLPARTGQRPSDRVALRAVPHRGRRDRHRASGRGDVSAAVGRARRRRTAPAPEFASNTLRAENRAAINAEIEERTMRQSSEHWVHVLNEAGVPCSRVMHLDEVFADPQVVQQQAVVTVAHPGHGGVSMLGSALHVDGAPLPVRLPAPELGANTVEVLGELGLSAGEIDQLRERGIV